MQVLVYELAVCSDVTIGNQWKVIGLNTKHRIEEQCLEKYLFIVQS